eukprot:TRINITY_DN954_c0_g1_i1.p1 TRINITY_DN954_c0_g1~~TRINITY_DN954_c0_g1_i1.p1  ORF type:complete len:204 (-),score=49.07 TRINITY_DN954_c0_g1_i1:48-659(-)
MFITVILMLVGSARLALNAQFELTQAPPDYPDLYEGKPEGTPRLKIQPLNVKDSMISKHYITITKTIKNSPFYLVQKPKKREIERHTDIYRDKEVRKKPSEVIHFVGENKYPVELVPVAVAKSKKRKAKKQNGRKKKRRNALDNRLGILRQNEMNSELVVAPSDSSSSSTDEVSEGSDIDWAQFSDDDDGTKQNSSEEDTNIF